MKKVFKELVEGNSANLYLGTGNPNSNILIIGKESAIDSVLNKEQYEREIVNNAIDWRRNLAEDTKQELVNSWFGSNPSYNPLYPYKGQLNKIENKKTGRNGGTSTTFYNYQKLIDKLFNENQKSLNINFHEKCFITELNSATAEYSHLVNVEERNNSIEKRQDLLTHSFYQSFPIVIIAVGHYVRDFNIDIQNLFKVKFNAEIGTIPVSKTNYINLHYDDLANPSRIVIHTNQLSINITDILLDQLEDKIKKILT